MESSSWTADTGTPAAEEAEPGARSLPAKPRVLIIDDDCSIREMIADFLTFEGYPIEVAANGDEGLRLIEASQPAIILLDMRMPVLDGWGFARALHERGIKLPLVVISAAANPPRWAAEINADGFLSKPFDLGDLLSLIERLTR